MENRKIQALNHPWRFAIVAAAVVLAHFILIASTWSGMGYTKDEGYYFSASDDNFGWYQTLVEKTLEGKPFEAFKQRWVDRHWRNNNEHPPFCKTMQGFNHMLWYEKLNLMNFGNSHRMSTVMFSSILIVFMLLLASEWMGLGWAVLAVALLYSLPRFFFHAHINTFDVPVVAAWFATAYAFRRSMVSVRWSWVTGLFLGIGLATKNNTYFLPVLFLWLYIASPYWKMFWRSVEEFPSFIAKASRLQTAFVLVLIVAPVIAFVVYQDAFNIVLLVDLALANLFIAWHWLRSKPVVPDHIAPIVPAMITAPFVFFILWPWIWYNPWQRLAAYFERHINPPAWETYYLHNIIVNPPPFDWHYPFVMSFYTIPAAVLLLMLLGIGLLLVDTKYGRLLRGLGRKVTGNPGEIPEDMFGSRQPLVVTNAAWDRLFLFANILLPFLIIANPKAPIYGGTKHWATAQPFMAIAAVMALRWLYFRLIGIFEFNEVLKRMSLAFLALSILIPGAIGIAHVHPHTLSYYNEIMGGSIAAPEVGMQRTFWAASSRKVLDYLNEHVPKGGSVWWNNTPWTSYDAYQKDGFLRKDIRHARLQEHADYAVMNHWKYYTDGIYKLRSIFKAPYAEHSAGIDGMPLVEVYKNYSKVQYRNIDRARKKEDGKDTK